MSKFYIGQKVRLLSSMSPTKHPPDLLQKDFVYIVNGIKSCSCNVNPDRWLDLGLRLRKGPSNTGTCKKCRSSFSKDGTSYCVSDTWFESAEEIISDKYVVQVELLNLLANGHINYEFYKKVHNMTNGDEEMLNLANLLIKNHNGHK